MYCGSFETLDWEERESCSSKKTGSEDWCTVLLISYGIECDFSMIASL